MLGVVPGMAGRSATAQAAASSEGKRLRRLRARLGLTQREMAAELGVTSAAIALWETDKRAMPGPALRLVALYERELAPLDDDGALRARPSFVRRSASGLLSVVWYGLGRILPEADEASVPGRVRAAAIRRYVETLGELKGLGMKLGQMMGYMAFLLPEDLRAALAELPTRAPPTPPHVVARTIDAELGAPPTDVFASWDAAPFAVASVGQVHRATTRDGGDVAVKVQHAGIVADVLADLRHVKTLDRLYSAIFRGQPEGVIHEELRARIVEELDYEVEAANLAEARRIFAHRPDVVVPEPLPALSTARVLVTRFEPGLPFERFAAEASPAARDAAGATIFAFYWEAALGHGLFHADPHPGNFAFRPDAAAVVFYDFGRVKRLSPAFSAAWRAMFRALLERDRDGVTRAFVAMDSVVDPARFDADYGFRSIVACFLPCLVEGAFVFDEAFVREAFRVYVLENVNTPLIRFTADMILLHQLQFGVTSALARLGARVDARRVVLDQLYAPGEPRPSPYGEEELRLLGFGGRAS